MTVPFMFAYWITILAVLFIAWFAGLAWWTIDDSPRSKRLGVRVGIVLAAVWALALLVGIWIPVFVPGLY